MFQVSTNWKKKGGGAEASGNCRLLVCTLSHKGEPLSRALSRAFQGTKANDTVPGMSCVCSGSLMVFRRRSYACLRLFPQPPPPFPAAAACICFVNKEHRLSRCARGPILLGSDSCRLPVGDRALGTAYTGLISGLQPDFLMFYSQFLQKTKILNCVIAVEMNVGTVEMTLEWGSNVKGMPEVAVLF